MKMFYTSKEAAKKLGIKEAEIRYLGQIGQLQEFMDRDQLMFKKEQVDLLYATTVETGSLLVVPKPEEGYSGYNKDAKFHQPGSGLLRVGPLEVEDKKPTNTPDWHAFALIVTWAFCGLIVLVGLFARRMWLLEIVGPVAALLGFILLGIYLIKYFNKRKLEKEAEARDEETRRLLEQVERIKKMNNDQV